MSANPRLNFPQGMLAGSIGVHLLQKLTDRRYQGGLL